jgi:hypothetical protein
MCDLEHELKLRLEKPLMFEDIDEMMAEEIMTLRKRITELEKELVREQDKNISIINWANACEEHGLRNQKDIVEMAEKCIELEDENTALRNGVEGYLIRMKGVKSQLHFGDEFSPAPREELNE